ncbi:hypothetical protein NM688_g7932 [Phlebia brevispora]|uniref:Uncharacterized protein n=1 Tax=Phlebia brevispora TaxID=194682 RepID=A0ACC1RZG5_9APHY|nr:hypothetical protein NM688_g7932 [Phlebia brevispora]
MSANISKKRKRGSDDSDEVTLQVSAATQSQAGPLLASFPAIQPPKSTPFRVYLRKGKEAPEDTLLVGETDTVEFVSTDEAQTAAAGCSYLVGVYDKRTKTTTLRPAPLHILSRQVKALKRLKPIQVSTEERMKQRNLLGETFGTKKAKAAIRAQERNRVDIDAMQGVAGHLQERIEENTGSLPTQGISASATIEAVLTGYVLAEEAKAVADSSRLIPPYDEGATRADDVYKLHSIVPEAEFNALSISRLKSASNSRERISALPYSRSNWINQHINLLFSAPKPNKTLLKMLLYISAMFAFKNASRLVNDKPALQERLKDVPSIVVDGLLSRFTETSRDNKSTKITPQTETMLLSYMFALCLRVDDYATDTTLLAKDLSMAVTKVNPIFKSLGCKIESLSSNDLKQLGLPDSAADTKRAVLKVPLEFPKPRVRRAGR